MSCEINSDVYFTIDLVFSCTLFELLCDDNNCKLFLKRSNVPYIFAI